jgi:hypothetical protein
MEEIQLRDWQKTAFRAGKDERFFLNQSPGGSGKSLLQCALGAYDLAESGGRRKQLILVPQSQISQTFSRPITFKIGGKTYTWKVDHNLCDGRRSTGRDLKRFLLSGASGEVCISTHQGIVYLWPRLTAEEKRQVKQDLTVRLDEAHHIAGVMDDDSEININDDVATKLGKFAQAIIRAKNTKLHLTTATFFRGDATEILSPGVRDKFTIFKLDWDEYFPTLGIDDLRFHYFDYAKDPIKEVCANIAAEPGERHLIIIPPTNRKFRNEDSFSALMKALKKVMPTEDRILDMVTPGTQETAKRRLERHPEQYNVIVACRLFNEGTDWPACNRLQNLDSCEQSLTLAVQRFFRPLRKFPNKRKVSINNYVPRFDATALDRREILSDRFTAVMTALLTHGELLPVCVPITSKVKGQSPRQSTLQEIYGNAEYRDVVADLVKEYEAAEHKDDAKEMKKIVARVIKSHDMPSDVDPDVLADALLVQLTRIADPDQRSLRKDYTIKSIDLETIKAGGFDKVWAKVRKDGILFYGTDNFTPKDMRELLNLLDNPLTEEEIKDGVRKYHARTGERITFYSGYIPELKISAHALAGRLKRQGTTLPTVVTEVLGDSHDQKFKDLIPRVQAVAREYATRGQRLTKNLPAVPEFGGITGMGLDNRLKKVGTTLGAVVEAADPKNVRDFTLAQIRKVVKDYRRRGQPLTKRSGSIPELGGIQGAALNERLRRDHGTTLAGLCNRQKSG